MIKDIMKDPLFLAQKSTDATKALIKALKSDTVKKYINDKYDGAVVPLF
jgi:D-methionine transport system substrate-binding protein